MIVFEEPTSAIVEDLGNRSLAATFDHHSDATQQRCIMYNHRFRILADKRYMRQADSSTAGLRPFL